MPRTSLEGTSPGQAGHEGSAPDVSGTHVWLVLMKAHRSLERHAQGSIDTAEIGLSDFATLEVLLHKGPLPVNEIGRRIHLTSGSITTAVDRMQERGLVVRGADPADRRARVVSLTAKGRALITRVFRRHEAAMDHAAHGLSEKERATLVMLLRKLGRSADEHTAEGTS